MRLPYHQAVILRKSATSNVLSIHIDFHHSHKQTFIAAMARFGIDVKENGKVNF